MGREVFLALKYSPQALQIVAPCGDLLQRGVLVVPQLLGEGESGIPSVPLVRLTCTLGLPEVDYSAVD